MPILRSMAPLARGLGFLLTKRRSMATHTLCLAVFAHERKTRLPLVGKVHPAQRTFLGRMTEFTILGSKELAIVRALVA